MDAGECLHSAGVGKTYQNNYGVKVTVFPTPIALGATFDKGLVEEVAAAVAIGPNRTTSTVTARPDGYALLMTPSPPHPPRHHTTPRPTTPTPRPTPPHTAHRPTPPNTAPLRPERRQRVRGARGQLGPRPAVGAAPGDVFRGPNSRRHHRCGLRAGASERGRRERQRLPRHRGPPQAL